MYCNQCGTTLELSARECPKCGQAIRSPAASAPSRSDDALLEAAVGLKNIAYYRRRFEKFAAGRGLASWSWPAFFVPLLWMLYRKMWLYSLLYFVALPAAFYLLIVALALALPDALALGTAGVVALATAFVLIPMYANALYYRVVRARIAEAKARGGDHEKRVAMLARRGGTSNVVWAVLAIGGVAFVGIVAAIAIPAYQDFTVREEVGDGFDLADEPKEAVERVFVATGKVPADRAGAGLTPNPAATSGRHVSGVDVVNGRVEIVYGNGAFAALAGKKLALTPYAKREDDGTWSVVWRCGYAGAPEATREISSYATSTVDPRYLPSGCRSPVER